MATIIPNSSTNTKPDTSSKPTIIFVHGSWHIPAHFGPVRKLFESHGYNTVCPAQASSRNFPPVGIPEDAKGVQAELERLVVHECKDVIVVCHSYGCVVTSQAVEKKYAKAQREKEGLSGGVTNLLFMCGFMLEVGVGIAGAFDGKLPPFIVFDENEQCYTVNSAAVFYQDLPEAEQQHWVSLLVKVPSLTQYQPITYAAYLYHPVTYLFCEQDQGLPVAYQRMMVDNVVAKTGIDVKRETCESGHSPFLSMPDKVLEVVEKMAQG